MDTQETRQKLEGYIPRSEIGRIVQELKSFGKVEFSGITREISDNTRLYTIIGIGHLETKAQYFHEALNIQFGFDQHHFKPVEISDFGSAIEDLVDFDMRGVTVTMPLKEVAFLYIEKGGEFGNEETQFSGAVNTIINERGRLVGWNTDIEGFIGASILSGIQLPGIKASIVGCGGMGRAALCGLALNEARSVTLFDIDTAKAQELAKECTLKFPSTTIIATDSLENCLEESEYVIQCTPEGMASQNDPISSQRTAVPIELLRQSMAVIDAVNIPLDTRFIRDAQHVGCYPAVRGVDMVVHGGLRQIQLYLGHSLPENELPRLISVGREALLEALK